LAGHNRRSSMFVGSLVAAIAATAALFFLYALQVSTKPGPPPNGQNPNGGPPPSPFLTHESLTSAITILAAIAAVAWVATIAAAIRDQILRDMNRILTDYAEMRETDGFLNGLRQASRPDAEVRQLHRVPPID
jgi:hypothetical protein